MNRIRIKYSKEGNLKYISHLDLMRVFERAIRRAEIPIIFSQGFNPRMKISYGMPLKLGKTSDSELADLFIEDGFDASTLEDKLNQVLPPGIKVLDSQIIDLKAPSIASSPAKH